MNLPKEYEDNISLYDMRTRNNHYISPEQKKIGEELAQIASKKNGKIVEDTYEIQEFLLMKKYAKPVKINKSCDVYSLGAIIFKLLLGKAPSHSIASYIEEHKLCDNQSDCNVYEIPFFFKDYILSNDLC